MHFESRKRLSRRDAKGWIVDTTAGAFFKEEVSTISDHYLNIGGPMFRSLSLLGVTAVTACSNPFATNCTTEIRPSVAVTVMDSISRENLAPEATVRIVDDRFSAVLAVDEGTYIGPMQEERTGTYTVAATHPDYISKSREGVTVDAGECHVITREISIGLARKI